MKNALIIIHYNDINSLKNLINNIKGYKLFDEVVIYDNNSNDDIKKELEKLKNVTLILGEENKGYSYAINKAAKYLIDKYETCNMIISNCDVVIDKEEYLKMLIDDLEVKGVGLVAPTIKEKNKLNRGWKQPTPLQDVLLSVIYFHRFFEKKYVTYPDTYYKEKYSFVDIVSGCMFAIKSDVLKEVNYLDENIFLYYEENILCKKLKSKNYKVLIDNESFITHNHSVSVDKNISKIKKYKILKKSQVYFEKNYNKANIFEIFLLRLVNTISGLLLRIKYLFK